MLKSTVRKLQQKDVENDIELSKRKIEQQKLELERERFSYEKNTKDRVDISLNEYNQMKENIKNLQEENFSLDSQLMRLIKPLIQTSEKLKTKFSPDYVGYVIKSISNGTYRNIDVAIIEEPISPLTNKVCFTFTIDKKIGD